MAHPKVKLSDDSGNAVSVTSNRLDVNAHLAASPTIDIGDVSLLLGGTAASVNNGASDATTLRVTIASDTTGVLSVDDNGSTLSIDDGGGSITIDGTVDLGSTATTHLSEIEGAVETIEGAVSGSEMQVDIVASLPAGSAAIGKLAANSGVDIGDVDVTSTVQPVGFSSVGHGSNTDVGTSAEVLTSSTACKHVDIMAATANTGIIYVGGSGVTTTTGIALYAGDVYSLDIDDLNDVYVIASVNGEDVQWVYYN